MSTNPNDCLVIVQVSSRKVAATVAWRDADGERVVAHKGVECDWYHLEERGRRQAIAEALNMACQSAGVEVYSVFVSVADPSLRGNFATGFADFHGETLVLTENERAMALARATHQPIGTEREVLHALPQRWAVKDEIGEKEVDDPTGARASRLTCHVLLISAGRETRSEIQHLLDGCEVYLEGMIAQPVALYRGLQSHLPKRGSTLIIDCGARFTSLLVHRKQRLVHVETHPFGGDQLTEAIARELGTDVLQAEHLKRELDISIHAGSQEIEGQTFLWRDVQERHRQLAPAARVCAEQLREFFTARAKVLRDLELLAQHGKVHLTGRAAALGGLPAMIKDVFQMPVVYGSSKSDREVSSELADLMTVGLVRQAAQDRERRLAERQASGVRQVAHAASGLWGWLTTRIQ
ncbi:MAG: pilus assembly protein PilM [Planctomycetota bacterium]|jgi:cell division protein FtsA|nr:pilus assembly protein PilM [Planctomycetota bacterium]